MQNYRIVNREGDRDICRADGSVVRETRTWYAMGGQFEVSSRDTYTVSAMPCGGAFAPGWTEGSDGIWRRGAIVD